MSVVRVFRLLLLVAMSFALAGCFTSKQPVFDEAQAVAALGDGGRFATYSRNGRRFERDNESFDVRRNGTVYDFIDAKGVAMPVSFHPLGRKRFVAQTRLEGGDYAYTVVRINAGEALVYTLDCDKQSATRLKALGVEIRNKECVLDKVTHAKALFTGLSLGRPTSKLVRE
jgi:hypothetical protein